MDESSLEHNSTFGEFFDRVRRHAEGQRWFEATGLMDTWMAIPDGDPPGKTHEDVVAECRARPMNTGQAELLAAEMLYMFQWRLDMISGEELYAMVHSEGHEFLDVLCRISDKQGYDVSKITSSPMTFSEQMIRAGVARVVTKSDG